MPFFNKIRKDQIKTDGMKRYLLYAVGEIVLVVIGILIALQLDNYNGNLKQEKQELRALQNLKLDFGFNFAEIQRTNRNLKTTKNVCLSTINHTGSKFSNRFEVDSLVDVMTWTPQYYPQNGFLLELVNSGNFEIISNDILRNRLSSWLPTLETLHEREKFSLEFSKDVIRFIVKNGSWLNADEMSKDQQVREVNFPKSGFQVDNNQMLKSVEFENLIENQIMNQTILLERQERCIRLNKEILNLLDLELKKQQ